MLLPERPDPPMHYRLVLLKGGKDWITDNQRLGWRQKSRLVKAWRSQAGQVARLAMPQLVLGAHVIGELRFSDNRRRDPNNWNPTAKACIDGLVDARVFPDDNHTIVVGPDMRIGPPVAVTEVALILHFWPTV